MDIEKLFEELGYTKDEYKKIIDSYSISMLNEEILENKIKENYNLLKEMGPEFDSCEMQKTPNPLFYKGLRSFILLKKMRTLELIKLYLKFFSFFYNLLFHNQY